MTRMNQKTIYYICATSLTLLLTACSGDEDPGMTASRHTISLSATFHPLRDSDDPGTRAVLSATNSLKTKYIRAWGYYQDNGNLLKSGSSTQESIQLQVNAAGLGDTNVDWPESAGSTPKAMRFYATYPESIDNVVTDNSGMDGSSWSVQPKISYEFTRDQEKDLMYGTCFDQYFDDVLEPSIPIQMKHITTALRFRKSDNIDGEMVSVEIDGVKTAGYYQETYNETTKMSTGQWTAEGEAGSIIITNTETEKYIYNGDGYGTSVVYVMPQVIAGNSQNKITVTFSNGRTLEGVLPPTEWRAGYIVNYELGKSSANNSEYKDIKHGLLYYWYGSLDVTWSEETRLLIAMSDRIKQFLITHMNQNSFIKIEYSPTNKSKEMYSSVMVWNNPTGEYVYYNLKSLSAGAPKADTYTDTLYLEKTKISSTNKSLADHIREGDALGTYLDYPLKIGRYNITIKKLWIYLDDLPND